MLIIYLKFQVIKQVEKQNLISKQKQILIKLCITETDYLGTVNSLEGHHLLQP